MFIDFSRAFSHINVVDMCALRGLSYKKKKKINKPNSVALLSPRAHYATKPLSYNNNFSASSTKGIVKKRVLLKWYSVR